jgi:hypothetical protein
MLRGPDREGYPRLVKRVQLLSRSEMYSNFRMLLVVRDLEGIQVVAIAPNNLRAVEALLGDSVDEIDRKRDVDALLLTVRCAIALKEFKPRNMAIRSLHRKEPAFPRLVWRRRSVEPGKHELVGSTKLLDQRAERGIAESGTGKGANQVAPVDQNSYSDRELSQKETRRRCFSAPGVVKSS